MRPGRQHFPDTRNVSARIRRVTTTRAGGVSKPPFDTFNLGDHVGDDAAAVRANRSRLLAAIGLPADRVVWMNQVHGTRIEVVEGPRGAALDDTDGVVTATPRLALAVVTADCVPVLLADARAGVVGAVHAGRVGAQHGVVARAVETMLGLGAQADDISALLGPAVSGHNYEVPAAMAAEVEAALPGSRTTTAAGTPGLDLRTGIAGQLRALGVTSIKVDPRCTVADPTLFSHRRDAPTGRLASLVWME
jgi:polyphenol oxidase